MSRREICICAHIFRNSVKYFLAQSTHKYFTRVHKYFNSISFYFLCTLLPNHRSLNFDICLKTDAQRIKIVRMPLYCVKFFLNYNIYFASFFRYNPKRIIYCYSCNQQIIKAEKICREFITNVAHSASCIIN